jgi:hypothetical protein
LRGKKVNDHGKENKKDFISSSFFSHWTQQLQRQKKKGKEKSFSFHQILRKKPLKNQGLRRD